MLQDFWSGAMTIRFFIAVGVFIFWFFLLRAFHGKFYKLKMRMLNEKKKLRYELMDSYPLVLGIMIGNFVVMGLTLALPILGLVALVLSTGFGYLFSPVWRR